jgi:hypothetical protein
MGVNDCTAEGDSNQYSTCGAVNRRSFLRYSAIGGLVAGGAALGIVGCSPTSVRDDGGHYSAVQWPGGQWRFYVSNDGHDCQSGLTPDQAWRTIARLNEALQNGAIQYGDSVLFRRGDEFFGAITTLRSAELSADGPRLTLSAYGYGDRPKISGYKVIDPQAWQPLGGGVWRVNLTDGVSYSGNLINAGANTGFIRVDGRIYGAKKWRLDDLTEQWDFFDDSTYVYVKSNTAPGAAADDIRVAVDGTLVRGYSRLSVQGLELVGSGGHGYRQSSATNTEFVDCRVHEIGGAKLEGTSRYGNGVELWMGSSDAVVERNEIFDVYDTACTLQGEQEGADRIIERCHFRSNNIWNCSQSFEYWGIGTDDAGFDGENGTDGGFIDCTFTDNVCINGGQSWGYAVREDKAGKGNFLMAYRQELPTDIRVMRNVFFDARDCYIYVNTNNFLLRDGYVCDENVIALRPGTLIQAQMAFTIEQSAQWVAEVGQDVHSRWMQVPSLVMTPDDSRAYVTENLDALRGH